MWYHSRRVLASSDGSVFISSHARTESVLAQTSPEAEYLSAVTLASEMRSIATATRHGLGQLRNLEVKRLWLQQVVGAGQIK